MLTRRDLLATTALCAALPLAGQGAASASAARACDPFIGTGGVGHTYPAATAPWGMVQPGPDTDTVRWEVCSGYHADDPTILGFSNTHLSGTGVGDMMDVLIAPGVGPVRLRPGAATGGDVGYRQRFDRATERARPGFYGVALANAVEAELTTADRAALHRYHFPKPDGHLLVDWGHSHATGTEGVKEGERPPIVAAMLELRPDGTLVGSRRVRAWAYERPIHFALRVSRPPAAVDLYRNDAPVTGRLTADGLLKAVLRFTDADREPIVVKVAVRNLDADPHGFDFERMLGATEAAWQNEFGRIEVEGGNAAQRRIFDTALYHAMLAPTLMDDVDGRYFGMDHKVHQLDRREDAYSTYSFWDSYRAVHPLLSLTYGDRARSLLADIARHNAQAAEPLQWMLQGFELH